MLSYQTLDTIADAYIPALFILCLCLLIKLILNRNWQTVLRQGGLLVMGLVVAYALMFIDQYFSLWPMFDLDYSTHSAVSLVLIITLSVMLASWRMVWWLSLLGYFLLMLYQQYHSLADIISTVLIVGAVLFPLVRSINLKNNTGSVN